jgi:hypothetical protein
MENATRRSAFLRACVIGVLTLASYQPAVATEALKDVSKEMSELRSSATTVDLYLAAKDVTYRADLHEADVLRMGCHYRAQNAQDVGELLDLVVNANWVSTQPSVYGYDARIVVHVHQGNAHYVSLVITPDYSNAYARGMYYSGPRTASTQEVTVEARSKIEKDLRFWASQHETLVVKPSCHFR